MGYTVLGIAVAGALVSGEEAGRELALTGATVEMVAHGLITGSLFLIAGSFWARTEDYELDHYGGLAGRASRLTGVTTLAAFASLGLPGLAGFVAEFQIFVGTFSVYPVLAGIALLGVLITAALFLQMMQATLLRGAPRPPHRLQRPQRTARAVALVPLLVLVVLDRHLAHVAARPDHAHQRGCIVGARCRHRARWTSATSLPRSPWCSGLSSCC